MKMQFMRAVCDRAAAEQGQPGTPIRFVASTEAVARDGKALLMADWRLENYRANPVVLWVHDYMGRNLPIGRTVAVEVMGSQLLADVEFDQADDFARAVESKYRRGFLNAVSVGWQDVGEGKRFVHDLMDISAVPVPADPGALAAGESVGRAFVEAELRAIIGEEDGDQAGEAAETSDAPVWSGVASAMLDLFRSAGAMDDEKRHSLYIVLERAYRKLDKEPPEWLTADELVYLGRAEIDGLFLEGEPGLDERASRQDISTEMSEARVGAVLSARNRGELEQAISLIRGVLDRAKKEEPAEKPAEKPASDDAPSGDDERECDKDKKRGEPASPSETGAEPEDDAELVALHRVITGKGA